jgi:hypothetical protein
MKTLLWILPVVLLAGCAGSRCRLTARSVQQPVSCTPCVLDSAGRVRKAQPSEVVNHFVLTKSNWSMLWKALPLSQREWDASQELDAKLRESSGNAIVNLTVRASGSDFLDWYIAALVPILPSYVTVRLEGDVVRIPDAP